MGNLTRDQEYEISLSVLKSITAIRAMLRDLNLEQVSEIVDKFEKVKQEKEDEYLALTETVEKQEAIRLEIVKSLEDNNMVIPPEFSKPLTVETMQRLTSSKPAAKKARAKFAVKDDSGNWLTWSGRGRMAAWLKDDKYKSIEESKLAENAKEYNKENNL